MGKILVTGGCGYIGSHTVVDLIQHGFDVVVADSFVRGSRKALAGMADITGKVITNYEVDLCDLDSTEKIFQQENITGVIHFAALKSVPESVQNPVLYYRNNLDSLLSILQCAEKYKVQQVVFSSSASVYGNATTALLKEDTPLLKAESPYGHTKQMGEEMIEAFSKNVVTKFISLRYFNPSGAHQSALIGERPAVTYNVTPRITATAMGKFEKFMVYGNDYPTRDGTCVRDYIHVMDIAHAHTKALQYLQKNKQAVSHEILNLGTSNGVTVMELIRAFEKAAQRKLNYEIASRRPGDVTVLVADATRAKEKLGWQTTRTVLEMMQTAWAWEQAMAAEAN